MGYVRLGRLPATRKWKEIVQFLASDGFSVADLADRVRKPSQYGDSQPYILAFRQVRSAVSHRRVKTGKLGLEYKSAKVLCAPSGSADRF